MSGSPTGLFARPDQTLPRLHPGDITLPPRVHLAAFESSNEPTHHISGLPIVSNAPVLGQHAVLQQLTLPSVLTDSTLPIEELLST